MTEGDIKKPPIGLIPKWLWKEQRAKDISAAILRYLEAGIPITSEWMEEWNELIGTDGEIKYKLDTFMTAKDLTEKLIHRSAKQLLSKDYLTGFHEGIQKFLESKYFQNKFPRLEPST